MITSHGHYNLTITRLKATHTILAHLLLVSFTHLHAAETPADSDLSDEAWATVAIDVAAPSVPYSPMIFGGFLEHFQTRIYGGILDPGSPLSNGE